MADVHNYRLKCTTENDFVYTWNTEAPTVCPNDNTHTIDTNSITKITTVSSDMVEIKEETTNTGGNFGIEGIIINASGDSVTNVDKSWPIPISIFSLTFTTETDHTGDIIDIYVSPDTITGAIVSDVSVNDTVISVSQTVIDNIFIGYYIKLYDTVNTDDLGMVTNIDKSNNTITVQNASTNDYSLSSPTYVLQTIRMVRDLELGPPWKISFGRDKIGGSYLPSGTVIRLAYKNNTSAAKKLNTKLEFLY